MSVVDRVAEAIFNATVEDARKASVHVASWETVPPYWRAVFLRQARAAVAELEWVNTLGGVE